MKKIEKGTICIIIGEPDQIQLNGKIVETIRIINNNEIFQSDNKQFHFTSDYPSLYPTWIIKSCGGNFQISSISGKMHNLSTMVICEKFLKPLPDIDEDNVTDKELETHE